jgi:hypothetical protein
VTRREQQAQARQAAAEVSAVRDLLVAGRAVDLAGCPSRLGRAAASLRALMERGTPFAPELRVPLEDLRRSLRLAGRLAVAGSSWAEQRLALLSESAGSGYTSQGTEAGPVRSPRLTVQG